MSYFINMTITTTVTAIGILLIKGIFKNKMSPKFHVLIWVILAIRILAPILPESQLSIFNLFSMVKSTTAEINHIEEEKAEINTITNINKTTEIKEGIKKTTDVVTQPLERGVKSSFKIIQYFKQNILKLWIVGTIVLLCYFIFIYLLFSQKIGRLHKCQNGEIIDILSKYKDKMKIKRNVFIVEYGKIPMLKGVFKPVIILPEKINALDLEYVIVHELCHIKYHDILINIVSTILLCINWYNPVIWMCHYIFRGDIELLCDQRIFKIVSGKKEYAKLLLKTSFKIDFLLPGTTSMNGGKKQIKRRIYFMTNYRKPKILWTLILILFIGLFGTSCLLNKKGIDPGLIARNNVESQEFVEEDNMPVETPIIFNKDKTLSSAEETAPALSSTPVFQPYIYVYEVIGVKNGGEPVQIPISSELLGEISEVLKPENEVDVDLDVDLWKTGGNYTDVTYSWIGISVVLDSEKSFDNRDLALMFNPRNEGILCEYWDENDNKRAYEATNLCREIIELTASAIAETEYGTFTKFTLINEIKDIVKVESFDQYGGEKLKEYTDNKTIDSLEKLLTNSIEGGIGANATSITGNPYYTLKLTRVDGEEFILQFAPEEYLFKVNNWMVYMHESGDFNNPMKDFMKILELEKWPNYVHN